MDEDPLGQVKFVHLFKVTVLNLHVIMMKPETNLIILETIVRILKEGKPLRLLLNLLFYHFNRSKPTYKSQRIKLLDVIAACNQLNVSALN